MRHEAVRSHPCPVLGKVVRVSESYSIAASGACPVSSALESFTCESEPECRAAGLLDRCRLWDLYEPFFGPGS